MAAPRAHKTRAKQRMSILLRPLASRAAPLQRTEARGIDYLSRTDPLPWRDRSGECIGGIATSQDTIDTQGEGSEFIEYSAHLA